MKFSCTRNILLSLLAQCFALQSIAQSSSYDANSVPIGGLTNVAFGFGALSSNTGFHNNAVGYNTLHSNTTGNVNVAIGYAALYSNTTAGSNIAIGDSTMFANTAGILNTAIGNMALRSNISGYQIVAAGQKALYSNTTGINNTGLGTEALYSNTSGSWNTAVGQRALYSNTTSSSNTAIGSNALTYNLGTRNVGIGFNALFYNTTGSQNHAIGTWAQQSNTTGSNNVSLGFATLIVNTTGSNNVAVGDSAGYKNIGSGNIFLGKSAGFNELSTNNKLYIANDSNKAILYGDLSSGQVLIGKPQPVGYVFKGSRSLNVIGGILTDSVRVALSSDWADYVFADNYNLLPLNELDNFIKSNKHLPNIPAANEIKSAGLELAAFQVKLIEKIEELTLYVLQLQKQLNDQHSSDVLLKKEINALKKKSE